MNAFSLVVGGALLLVILYFAWHWQRMADWFQWWGKLMSEPESRPWWRRGHFRPNGTQAAVIAWLFIFIGGTLAFLFLAKGLGLT